MSQCQNKNFMKGAPPQQQPSPPYAYPQVLHFHAEWHPCGLSLKDACTKISESFKDWIYRLILWIDLID